MKKRIMISTFVTPEFREDFRTAAAARDYTQAGIIRRAVKSMLRNPESVDRSVIKDLRPGTTRSLISIRVSKEMVPQIDRAAEELEMSRSDFMRIAINRVIESYLDQPANKPHVRRVATVGAVVAQPDRVVSPKIDEVKDESPKPRPAVCTPSNVKRIKTAAISVAFTEKQKELIRREAFMRKTSMSDYLFNATIAKLRSDIDARKVARGIAQ